MNKFLILIIAISLGCGNAVKEPKESAEARKTKEESTVQQDMLLGEFTREDLQKQPFASWFEPRYEKYSPETEFMQTIAENINDYEIKLLMGTWCGDSKREVPKMLKILDEADFNYDNLKMVAVDHDKTTPSQIEKELDVHHVPTIIFYKDGKEVNRFVEYSQQESFEEDIALIVSGKDYQNPYAD